MAHTTNRGSAHSPSEWPRANHNEMSDQHPDNARLGMIPSWINKMQT